MGSRPRSWGRTAFVAAFLGCVGIAACNGLVGIGGFEVDPCFDGGCATDAGPDQIVPDDDAGQDAGVDACACPEGTSALPNGLCALPTGVDRKFIRCDAPLKLPDGCTTGISLVVCEDDAEDASILYPQSICSGDQDYTLPSVYVQLGASPTGEWISDIHGAFGIGPVNNCAQVSPQCLVSPLAPSKGVTNKGANNNVEFALGKSPDAGCSIITFITSPFTAPADAGSDAGDGG